MRNNAPGQPNQKEDVLNRSVWFRRNNSEWEKRNAFPDSGKWMSDNWSDYRYPPSGKQVAAADDVRRRV
jgi:hypothetical protein